MVRGDDAAASAAGAAGCCERAYDHGHDCERRPSEPGGQWGEHLGPRAYCVIEPLIPLLEAP
jgi:hypothetical protein